MFENKEKSASVKILELRTGERDIVQQIKYLQNELITSYNQKRLTKRAPDAGDSAHIPSSFLRLILFLAGRLRRPRPSAGNACRWQELAVNLWVGFSKISWFTNWRFESCKSGFWFLAKVLVQ